MRIEALFACLSLFAAVFIVLRLSQRLARPAQAVAITGDPDSPVIFHLRLGDGLAPKVIEHEPAPGALAAPLVAIATPDDTCIPDE